LLYNVRNKETSEIYDSQPSLQIIPLQACVVDAAPLSTLLHSRLIPHVINDYNASIVANDLTRAIPY
jgi:hypothetical protein